MAERERDWNAPVSGPEIDIERRLKRVDFRGEDARNLAAVKEAVLEHLDEHVAAFFDYLAPIQEARELFRRRALLEEAKGLKRLHLIAMVQGDYGPAYVKQRFELGRLYNQAALEVHVFLGAFHAQLRSIGRRILERFGSDVQMAYEHITSLNKLAFFDISIIVDAMVADRERTIVLQQEAIRELSTPTLQLRERLLVLPIIGMLDSHRAQKLTANLLKTVREKRARVVVMDVTGVATIDTKVANHLIMTVAAARLMGVQVIVTGISADVAQSLVTLGVDLDTVQTVGDLQGGLEEAEKILGYTVVRADGRAPSSLA